MLRFSDTQSLMFSQFRIPVSIRHALLAASILFLCFWIVNIESAYAAPLPQIQNNSQESHSIAFIPSIPIYIYKDVPLAVSIDTVSLQNDIIFQAVEHPYLKVISNNIIQHSNSKNSHLLDTAHQAEIDLGYADTLMSGMNYDSAISLLQRVIQNYNKSLLNYFDPGTVAKAYQMLAYAYVARYQEDPDNSNNYRHQARLAFMDFIRLAPHIMMLAGRQSPDRVEIYDEALELFLGSESYRQTPQRDATAIAHQLHADTVIFMRIVQDKSGAFTLEIDNYNAKLRTITYDKVLLDTAEIRDQEELANHISNAVTAYFSNHYDCIEFNNEQQRTNSNKPDHYLLFDIDAAYTFFLKHPTSNILHGAAVDINISLMFNKYLFLRIGTEIATLYPNDDHELYDSFRVYRFQLLFGFSKTWKYLRPYVATGIEFSFSADYTITNSVICKTFGTDDIECDPHDFTKNREPYSLSIPFVVGLNTGIDPFYLTTEIYAAPTAYPIQKSAFRHPMGVRLGVQYRF